MLDYGNATIVEEWLCQIDNGKEISIFQRARDENGQNQIDTEWTSPKMRICGLMFTLPTSRAAKCERKLFIRDVAKRAGKRNGVWP